MDERSTVTADLQARLASLADPATRHHWERYLKGAAAFRGVPMAGVRRAVRGTWRDSGLADLPFDTQLAIAADLFASPWSEVAHPELSPEGRRMASARLRPGPYRRR